MGWRLVPVAPQPVKSWKGQIEMRGLYRRLVARVGLALAVIKHLLYIPLFGRRVPGPWLARLRAELLAPTPSDLWEYVDETSNCIGCGICDMVGDITDVPSQWIRGSAREPSTAGLAHGVPERLRLMAEDIARVCPTRVPVNDIAKLLEANQQHLEGDS